MKKRVLDGSKAISPTMPGTATPTDQKAGRREVRDIKKAIKHTFGRHDDRRIGGGSVWMIHGRGWYLNFLLESSGRSLCSRTWGALNTHGGRAGPRLVLRCAWGCHLHLRRFQLLQGLRVRVWGMVLGAQVERRCVGMRGWVAKADAGKSALWDMSSQGSNLRKC